MRLMVRNSWVKQPFTMNREPLNRKIWGGLLSGSLIKEKGSISDNLAPLLEYVI